ncbi:MAG TPA: radical SAM protein [Myxococcota bacterium]|nr:radical SAM protein [Myxococcota bacterium]HOA12842.1 radical SAM protein [Myxococcota bacterium]HOC98768.1 radical SAM protein [Myxococcota bacterium]HOH76546.1 radical SAM protein [Myxococcota bacterium]HPV04575.1 radical SAM protein [Myxococcota bacterium]
MVYPAVSYRRAAAAFVAMASGDPVPLFASLELTLRCNGACDYCGSNRASAAAPSELPTASWMTILDDLARSGCIAVSFTGGEPLLRTDVEALASRAATLGMSVSLNTNGRLLEKRRSILKSVSRVTVSIDGIREVNDMIRGAGAFDAAVAAIRSARFAGVPVSVTAVISAGSARRLPDFLKWLASMDLKAMFQPAYDHMLRSGDIPANPRPDAAVLATALDAVAAAIPSGVVLNSRESLEIMSGRGAREVACFGGRFFVRVDHRGCVGVCGLSRDPRHGLPCIDAAGGIVTAMKMIGWPRPACDSCPSAARLEINRFMSAAATRGIR